jgi:hypothetical protein
MNLFWSLFCWRCRGCSCIVNQSRLWFVNGNFQQSKVIIGIYIQIFFLWRWNLLIMTGSTSFNILILIKFCEVLIKLFMHWITPNVKILFRQNDHRFVLASCRVHKWGRPVLIPFTFSFSSLILLFFSFWIIN